MYVNLSSLTLPVDEDGPVVLAFPGDGRLRLALGVADQAHVLVLVHRHLRGAALRVDDRRRHWGEGDGRVVVTGVRDCIW